MYYKCRANLLWLRMQTCDWHCMCAAGTAAAQQARGSVSEADTVMDSTQDAGQPTSISGVAAAAEPRAEVPPPSLTHPLPEHRIQARR